MEKKYALLFALVITSLIVANIYLFSIQFSPSKEKVVISRVIDGDTLELSDGRRIRLLNINAPEKNFPNSKLSTDYLRQFENSSIEIEIVGTDKYERTLARLYVPYYLNLELIKQGFASKFLVEDSETAEFANAEAQAIESSKGIWKKSPYFGCFESKIDEINEKVIIINDCNKINITSWMLKDESRQYIKFGNLEIGTITLHTHEGKNNATDIFWNSKTNIWNNDRDTLYLFDKDGNIAHFNIYGY